MQLRCLDQTLATPYIIVVVNKINKINKINEIFVDNKYGYLWRNEGNAHSPMVPIDRSDTRIDELKIFINIGNTIYHRRHRRRVIVKKVENTLSFFYIRARARFLTKTGSEHLCVGAGCIVPSSTAQSNRRSISIRRLVPPF